MRHMIRTLIVLAPLAVVGCKKSAPVEAPVEVAPPPAPAAPTFAWGAAVYEGGHMSDSVGTLTMPVVISNDTGAAITVTSYSVGVKADDGRVCVAKSSDAVEVLAGAPQTLTATAECMYQKLPTEGDTVQLAGVVKYTKDGEEKSKDIAGKVAISR